MSISPSISSASTGGAEANTGETEERLGGAGLAAEAHASEASGGENLTCWEELPEGDPHADIYDPDTYLNGIPHAAFARLRRSEPVSWNGDRECWSVVGYDDVSAVGRDYKRFTCTKGVTLERMKPDALEARRSMQEFDPPEHTRLRRLVNRGFTRRAVEERADALRSLAKEIVARALEREEFDFAKEVSRRLPMRVVAALLGAPDSDADQLARWADAMLGNADPEYTDFVIDQTDTEQFRLLPFRSPATLEVFDYADALADERRRRPRDDLTTALLAPAEDGSRLSAGEFRNFFALLVAAGNDTTRYSITSGMHALITHPDQLAILQGDLSLLPAAAEEILRWTSSVMHFCRTTTCDTTLGGASLSAGDKVVMWYASANYDETRFDRPYRFDVRRAPNEHASFGLHDPHLCLGAWLARLEIRLIFEVLLLKVRSIELAGEVERLRSNFIGGIKRLPVRVRTL